VNPIEEWLSFVHTQTFDEDWVELDLGDHELARLQQVLIADPDAGDVIPGTGGLRKLRFARSGEGKSGSLRVCYALVPDHGIVLLAAVYGKTTKANLTAAEKKTFKQLLDRFKARLDSNDV
jgi:hypothetical protein